MFVDQKTKVLCFSFLAHPAFLVTYRKKEKRKRLEKISKNKVFDKWKQKKKYQRKEETSNKGGLKKEKKTRKKFKKDLKKQQIRHSKGKK